MKPWMKIIWFIFLLTLGVFFVTLIITAIKVFMMYGR